MQAQFSQYGLLSILMLPLGLGLGTALPRGSRAAHNMEGAQLGPTVCMLMAAETSSTFFFLSESLNPKKTQTMQVSTNLIILCTVVSA